MRAERCPDEQPRSINAGVDGMEAGTGSRTIMVGFRQDEVVPDAHAAVSMPAAVAAPTTQAVQ